MSQLFDKIDQQDSELGKAMFYLSYTLLVIAMLLTMFYIFKFLGDIKKLKLYSSPLNIQSYKFKSMRIFDTNNEYFNILYISIIHGLSFILALIAFATLKNMTFSVYSGLFIGVLVIVLFIVMRIVNKHYKNTKSRIDRLNEQICGMIYKKTDFLRILRDSSTVSVFDIKDTIIKSLETIDSSTSERDLVKVFFTLTLFNHFAKIHHTNSEIERKDLFKVFDYSTLLCNSCKPVNYLHVSGTRIEQIVHTYIESNLPFNSTSASINAIRRCATIVENINEAANNLNLDESYKNVFIPIVFPVLAIQVLAILLIHSKDIISFGSALYGSIKLKGYSESNMDILTGIFATLFIMVQISLVLAIVV